MAAGAKGPQVGTPPLPGEVFALCAGHEFETTTENTLALQQPPRLLIAEQLKAPECQW